MVIEIGFEQIQDRLELDARIGGMPICNFGDAVRSFSITGGIRIIVRIQPQKVAPLAECIYKISEGDRR